MPSEAPLGQRPNADPDDRGDRYVDEESLVCRNYDSERTHEVTVRFVDADDDVTFRETYAVPPGSAVSISLRLPRAVYRVDARIDDESTASAECLVGSGPHETALVEVGNGLVSVAEGAF
ncbi:hypothetical protein [Halorientalis marina]|jgi:hypothetical protein|uniref:hypothetical protein n=1 Tax=Halorientalis marina TaxID=2931976 RepID=UPI001FF62EE9|nr:hypothetical protein [Halorientalis marina]